MFLDKMVVIGFQTIKHVLEEQKARFAPGVGRTTPSEI